MPALLIDPKGDLTNLCLTFPGLAAADFEPWVNSSDVAKAGVRMPNGPIKAVGEQTVTVSLHTDVQAEITVVVVGEVD